MASNKIRKMLKLRRDKSLVDTDTHGLLDQNSDHNGQSTQRGLHGNARSISKKSNSATNRRRGETQGRSGKRTNRKQNRTTVNQTCPKKEPPGDIPVPGPSHSKGDSDCIVIISDSDDDDVGCKKPHVKVSIKQSPGAASGHSRQVHSGNESLVDGSDRSTHDVSMENGAVGTFACKPSSCSVVQQRRPSDDTIMLLPDLADDEPPDIPSSSFKPDEKFNTSRITPVLLNPEASSEEFELVDQGASRKWNGSRKQHGKTRLSDTKSSANKHVIKCGKKRNASCKRRIIQPGPPNPLPSSNIFEASIGSSNAVSVSEKTEAYRSGHIRNDSRNHNIKPSNFEQSSDDDFVTSTHNGKSNVSYKRHTKFWPSNESSSDESVTFKHHHKHKDSLVKPASSNCESLSLTSNSSQTLKFPLKQHFKLLKTAFSPERFVTAEGDHKWKDIPDQQHVDSSTGSDEPLTDIMKRKMAKTSVSTFRSQLRKSKKRTTVGVLQTSSLSLNDSSAYDENTSHDCSAIVVGSAKAHTWTKRKRMHDNPEGSITMAVSAEPVVSCSQPNHDSRSTHSSSSVLSKVEGDENIDQRLASTSPPVDSAAGVMPYDNSSSCDDISPYDSSPKSSSPKKVGIHGTENSTTEDQPSGSLYKQTVKVSLVDIMSCTCADCSIVCSRFVTPHKVFTSGVSHSVALATVRSSVSIQSGDAYNSDKENNSISSRSLFTDFLENVNKTDPLLEMSDVCPLASRDMVTESSHQLQDASGNSGLPTAKARDIVQESRDILDDLDRMCDNSRGNLDEYGSDEKHHCGAHGEASNILLQKVDMTRPRGDTSDINDTMKSGDVTRSSGDSIDNDDDTERVDVTRSKGDISDNNGDKERVDVPRSKGSGDTEGVDVTMSKGDDSDGDTEGVDVTRSEGDNDDGDTEGMDVTRSKCYNSDGDMKMTDAVFSQQDDVISLLSDDDDDGDSVFANLTQLLCIKSEPTSESEQDGEKADIAKILMEELGEREELEERENLVILGEVIFPIKSEPASDTQQDLDEAGLGGSAYFPVGDHSWEGFEQQTGQALTTGFIKTEPPEEVAGKSMSVEMTSEAVSSEASGQTSRKGFLREVEQRLSDNEHEQNMIVREAAPEFPEEQSPDLPEEQSLERPEEQSPEDAVDSLIQKLKRHLPYLSADKKLWSNTATCDAQIPCNSQSADTTETTTEPWQQHGICEIVEPSPDCEIPNFSEDDSTPTTDGQETCESSEGNSTFMVLSESRRLSQSTEQCPRHSHSKSLRRMSIQATPKHKKTIGISPCRQSVAATSKHKKAICLSPLKIDMFYHRRHNKPSPQKGLPCRSVLKLSSLTWARNRKQSMKSGRDKHSEQVSREGVRRAQQQLKERECVFLI